ncbi:MAG TPA: hypothetical protein VKB80_19015 [Kofleriaceae bacterium]|nr:hypothetical protein [Kofleriaceae bacterium]
MTRTALGLALAAALSLAGAACQGKPSAGECDRVMRHVVDLEAADSGAGAVPPDQRAELEARKKSVLQSIGTQYCRDEMSTAQVKCALEAKTLAELSEKCEKS